MDTKQALLDHKQRDRVGTFWTSLYVFVGRLWDPCSSLDAELAGKRAQETQKYKGSPIFSSGDPAIRRIHEDSAYFSIVKQAKVGHTVPMFSKVLVCGQLQ